MAKPNKKEKNIRFSSMVKTKKNLRRKYNNLTRQELLNDLSPTYPLGGRFLTVGDMDLLLTKSSRKDEEGNPIYIGTLVKRSGLFKNKVSKASHIAVKKL